MISSAAPIGRYLRTFDPMMFVVLLRYVVFGHQQLDPRDGPRRRTVPCSRLGVSMLSTAVKTTCSRGGVSMAPLFKGTLTILFHFTLFSAISSSTP